MINTLSIQALEKNAFGPFRKPLYDSYCFSRIPATIRTLLTGEKGATLPQDTYVNDVYDTVLVLFIDSFGWQYFEKYHQKYPFLKRFVENGIASKITSQFPSTTTNHVTCMHTGLTPGECGLYEWFYYEPIVDACICPLHFSFAKDKGYNTLARAGVRPEQLFSFPTIYSDFAKCGIRSIAFQDKDSAKSPYSTLMFEGATVTGHKNFTEGLSRLKREMQNPQGKSYFFFYYGDIDGAGHEFGPDSEQVDAQVEKCFTHLEHFWQELTSKPMQKTAAIVIADHGMSPIHPETTWYINNHLPHFEGYIKRNANNELLVPAGSSRDMFLHIVDEKLDKAHKELSDALSGTGIVYKTEDLIKEGLFGTVTDRFRARAGNLVALPLGENSIWWYLQDQFTTPYRGHHGGLTKAEIETTFLFLPL